MYSTTLESTKYAQFSLALEYHDRLGSAEPVAVKDQQGWHFLAFCIAAAAS